MLAIILKDLHCYVSSRKYRRIQFITLGVLSFVLFIATVEFYAHHREVGGIEVGKQTYRLLIIVLFVVQFWVPRHAVEALEMERGSLRGNAQNGALLALTPMANWKVLVGKLLALVLWTTWGIWLTVPLFALSSYIGGLPLSQWVKCYAVLLMSCIFFALIGIGVALWVCPTRAKGISYGFVLAITLLPLLPSLLFERLPMLAAVSPLYTFLAIFREDLTHFWLWNIGVFCGGAILIFLILLKRMRKGQVYDLLM